MLKPAAKLGRKYQNPIPTRVGGPGLIFKMLGHYLTNREERTPREPLGPFHTDARIYAEPTASGLRVTWMGHSTLLIEIDGVRVLVDPIWDERVSPFSWMGPKRFFAPPLALAELPRIDIVLISHDHYDHLGKFTVAQLAVHPSVQAAQWITSAGVGALLRDFGVSSKIAELDWTESVTVTAAASGGSATITALPARHFSGRSLSNRFETLWSSFAIRGSRHNLYFGADSGYWGGFAEIAQTYGPFDLTMLDTGAYNDLWKDIHMGPDGAAQAYADMGAAGLLMPIHWGLFNLALHAWRWPIERMSGLADEHGFRLWSPTPGVPTEVVPGTELRTGWWRPQPKSR